MLVEHKYYGYKMTDDTGFAPCVTESCLSLACCKPDIRKRAPIGSWIAGFGGVALGSSKLIYLMQVERTMTFDEYFKCKGLQGRLDNIYFMKNGEHQQILNPRFHKTPDDKRHDTSVNRVLLARRFVYFGAGKVDVPNRFRGFIPRARTYCFADGEQVDAFFDWTFAHGSGVAGIPHKPSRPSSMTLVHIS
jgi:hypothetical protein